MQIGVPRETAQGERRVALVPEVVGKLKGQGLDVVVERGAGAGALIPDEQYEQAGARMVDDAGAVYESDVVVKVAPPSAEEVERLRSDGRADRLPGAADRRRDDSSDRADGRDELCDGVRATDQPRAVDGRALQPGEHRRLSRCC